MTKLLWNKPFDKTEGRKEGIKLFRLFDIQQFETLAIIYSRC